MKTFLIALIVTVSSISAFANSESGDEKLICSANCGYFESNGTVYYNFPITVEAKSEFAAYKQLEQACSKKKYGAALIGSVKRTFDNYGAVVREDLIRIKSPSEVTCTKGLSSSAATE